MEKWVDIKGYEGLYQISNLGNVKKLKRTIITKNNKTLTYDGMILKPMLNNKGYYYVTLIDKKGNKRKFYIHRLVAFAFCNKRENCNEVNHKDCNPQNNSCQNLEWVTHKENMQYAAKLNRMNFSKEWYEEQKGTSKCKPVIGENIETGERIYYSKISETEIDGFNDTNVSACCRGKRKSHKGYIWKFAG